MGFGKTNLVHGSFFFVSVQATLLLLERVALCKVFNVVSIEGCIGNGGSRGYSAHGPSFPQHA